MYESIPNELKERKQWVCVWNDSKVPMNAVTPTAASSADFTTWSSFKDATESVKRGFYDGIGYVFNDDYVGIDIDCGFDGNGLLTPLAVDIIKACGSYTEKSRSGRGVHIILKGKLPFRGKNNRNGVEIYQSARYFIMTGKKLLYGDIVENQKAIDYVIEKYFPVTVKELDGGYGERIYRPVYRKLGNGRIPVRPDYPPIWKGGRNISLTSLAGQLHTQGFTPDDIYTELLTANSKACTPPLPDWEIVNIVNSIIRYAR